MTHSSRSLRSQTPPPDFRRRPDFSGDSRALTEGWSGRGPAIFGVDQTKDSPACCCPALLLIPTVRHLRRIDERSLFTCAHPRGFFAPAGRYVTMPKRNRTAVMATANRIAIKSTAKNSFNAQDFLDSAGVARKIAEFKKNETIYSQGDPGRNVIYIQKG